MATHTGSEGTIKIGSTVLGELRSYTLEQTSDTIEDTSMGDSVRTYKTGLKASSGSASVFFDEADALFGKRSEIKDAHDRYANIEINYLPENNILGIRYSFPEVNFNTIWHLIKTHIDSKRFGFLSRTRFELRASMEQTEAQYQHARYGWDIYVRDIMVASHLRDEARRSNRVAKPWQTVKRPENQNS
jgi:hypothetical protein